MAAYFADNGVRTYVLKGSVISECYPVPSHRMSSDLDCFLLPAGGDDCDACEKGNSLIELKGYKVSRGYYKNSTFFIPALKVENHRYLTPFSGDKYLKKMEVTLQRLLREDAGADRIESTQLCRPPLIVSALFLVEHSYSHFLHEGLSLRHFTEWMMFRRRHEADLDWKQFDNYLDEFGLRRFFDAYEHVGGYILGERARSELSAPEQRMADSAWDGLSIPETLKGVRGKLSIAANIVLSSWKYRCFSPISMLRALWIQTTGFLFDRNPSLH